MLIALNLIALKKILFPLQKRNGMMDPDDFRACLISMGYDLVSATTVLLKFCLQKMKPPVKLYLNVM